MNFKRLAAPKTEYMRLSDSGLSSEIKPPSRLQRLVCLSPSGSECQWNSEGKQSVAMNFCGINLDPTQKASRRSSALARQLN